MDTLRRSSRSLQVKLAQRLLNLRLSPSPRLKEDSIFGRLTDAATRRFQRSRRQTANGVINPTTWRALGVTIDISHRVTLYAQPTNMTCWSAAASMLLNSRSCISSCGAAVGPTGGLRATFQNVKTFADALGLRMEAPQSWTVPGLAGLMRSGPIWVAGWVPNGHAVVYGGIHGDGTIQGTMIVIYDPWPPNVGAIRGEIYGDWVTRHRTATTYILHR